MDRIDALSLGMIGLVALGIIGMYIGSIDLAGVVTIEGLACAVALAAAQLQKYKCQVCPLYIEAARTNTLPNLQG